MFSQTYHKFFFFFSIFLIFFHCWIPKLWEWTWPWTFMDKKCTYVWSAHKWKNWKVCKHVYFMWCIIATKPNIKCTTSTHTYMCEKKIVFFCKFHYPLPPMCETKNLEFVQINGNHNSTSKHKQTKYFNL